MLDLLHWFVKQITGLQRCRFHSFDAWLEKHVWLYQEDCASVICVCRHWLCYSAWYNGYQHKTR